MLALSLLFILAIQLLHSDRYFKKEYVIQLTMLSDKMQELYQAHFNDSANVLKIEGNTDAKAAAFDELDLTLKKDIRSNARDRMLHVKLGNEATWSDFIGVINTIKKNKLNFYMINGNDFWIHTSVNASLQKEVVHDYAGHRLYKPFEIPIDHELIIPGNDLIVNKTASQFNEQYPSSLNFGIFITMFSLLCAINAFQLFIFSGRNRFTNTLS